MYKTIFGLDFCLGFELEDLPVNLVDNTRKNDPLPSFVFQICGDCYLLIVDYENSDRRSLLGLNRYCLREVSLLNKEVFLMEDGEQLFSDAKSLARHINKMMKDRSGGEPHSSQFRIKEHSASRVIVEHRSMDLFVETEINEEDDLLVRMKDSDGNCYVSLALPEGVLG